MFANAATGFKNKEAQRAQEELELEQERQFVGGDFSYCESDPQLIIKKLQKLAKINIEKNMSEVILDANKIDPNSKAYLKSNLKYVNSEL